MPDKKKAEFQNGIISVNLINYATGQMHNIKKEMVKKKKIYNPPKG